MKRSLTTRLYNLKQSAKFPDSSTLSTKVINYLVKCFSYAITQNKGNPKEIEKTIKCIVSHAFGNHADCDTSWCGYKDELTNYKHKTLPYGKDLFGDSLKNALHNIFNDYCTETVVNKIAQIHKGTKPLTVLSDQKIQKLDFMVAVRAMTFGWLALFPRETSDMPMLIEHWSASILNLVYFARITMIG